MKHFVLVWLVLLGSFANGQDALLVDTLEPIELHGIPAANILLELPCEEPINRIASLNNPPSSKSAAFWILLVISSLMTILYLNSKEQVKLSFKSVLNSSFALQQSRTDRQGNSYFYYLYLLFFMLGSSYLLFFSFNNFFNHQRTFWSFIFIVLGYFLFDFLFAFLSTLFSNSKRIVDTLHSSSLSYYMTLSVLIWPALIFVLFLDNMVLSKTLSLVFFAIISLVLLVKEFRNLQILLSEKVGVFSFHFFTYLCTFKILPVIVLIKYLLV